MEIDSYFVINLVDVKIALKYIIIILSIMEVKQEGRIFKSIIEYVVIVEELYVLQLKNICILLSSIYRGH